MLQRSDRGAGFVEPCLPSPAKVPPSGPDWLHEIKHDGFRILARRDAAGVRLYSRNGHDFGKRFPLIVAAVTTLPARSCLIDSEASVTAEPSLRCTTSASVVNVVASRVWLIAVLAGTVMVMYGT